MNQEKIGKFIASCRKEQGFTQTVLAEKLGITDRAVSKWETGRNLPDAAIMPELIWNKPNHFFLLLYNNINNLFRYNDYLNNLMSISISLNLF